ncbi:hypothetical protein [Lacticaseibacillus parakribbianus]|uniref:hypothetical protein n=1 Tax=Lacticaseibacillus parakribbianus TaxID=2970927 RepID=UPI0021CB65D7|nr:hypothetical protein [Lacticaseibacillus parakribbianus]
MLFWLLLGGASLLAVLVIAFGLTREGVVWLAVNALVALDAAHFQGGAGLFWYLVILGVAEFFAIRID